IEELDVKSFDRAELFLSRGLARIFQGKRDAALGDLERARTISRDAGSQSEAANRIVALATSKMGLVTGFKGKVDEAFVLFEEALAAAQDAKDDRTHGIVRKDLANVLSETGQNEEAIVELGRARKYLRAAGDTREEGSVLMMLGSRFVDDGRLRES